MKNYLFLFIIMATMIITSCTSTKVTSIWKEPNETVSLNKLNKVLVVALFKDETSRRRAEDEMVSYLKGHGVPSYDYLDTKISVQNEEAIRNKISGDGFDGAVTMRLVDVEKDKTYTPGNFSTYPTYYRSFSGYYFRNWSNFSTPGYYSTTKTYTIETNVYSIKEDKIIWSGLTETTNPNGVQKMTDEVAKVVYNAMVKEGFINEM